MGCNWAFLVNGSFAQMITTSELRSSGGFGTRRSTLSISSFDEARSKHDRNVFEGGAGFLLGDFAFDLGFTCVHSSTVTEGRGVVTGDKSGRLGGPELTVDDVASVDDATTSAKVTVRFTFFNSEIFGFI
jgi:hypothetical protein